MDLTVNYLAVLVATIAGFATGAVWYTALFGRLWLKAVGITPEDMSGKGMSAMPFIVSIVSNALMAWVLAVIVTRFGDITIGTGICAGAMAWLGFVATTIATNNAFPGRPWSLTAIDAGHWLAVLLVQGLVIGFFGV
jgi:Protein of unknown function (DUF1761)